MPVNQDTITPATTTTPRSLEVLIQHVRASVSCPHCHATVLRACRAAGGVHVARFADAYRRDLITAAEMAVTLVGMPRPALLRARPAPLPGRRDYPPVSPAPDP